MPNLSFNGQVQDMGMEAPQWTYYEVSYSGMDLGKLRSFVESELKRKGLEAVEGLRESMKDGRHVVSVRVRSKAGII